MVAVSFIGGGNQSTGRKPPTCRKSLVDGFLGFSPPIKLTDRI